MDPNETFSGLTALATIADLLSRLLQIRKDAEIAGLISQIQAQQQILHAEFLKPRPSGLVDVVAERRFQEQQAKLQAEVAAVLQCQAEMKPDIEELKNTTAQMQAELERVKAKANEPPRWG